ncbi:MAG: VCBS repeat-containing protein, partial [Planctomycetia bacterium]|nr:VCBS repeat-containing protein [Planctomycetia bacterium]
LNQGGGVFGPERRFRADGGLFDLADFDGEPAVRSAAKTAGLVIGRFTSDSRLDVLAINGASNTFSLLAGLAGGNLANPSVNQAGSAPTQVVAGDFNRDGKLDAAILNAGDRTIDIFLGDGQGNFVHRFTAAAGNEATGLAARDVTGDGVLDLLVGNVYGDLLIIQGNGDGTFKTFTRVEKNVPFVTTDLDGDGIADVIVANQAFDQALSQQRDGNSKIIDNPTGNFTQTGANGLMGPGNLMLVDMNKDGLDDIVIANSGSNDVRVHLATGANGQGIANAWELVARTFFAGTNPTGFTTADLNGDGLLDLLVANKGSNDVSILFGQVSGGNWTLTPGPRLSVGAGPIGVEVRNVVGDATPDLVVSNSLDGTISILTGLGSGFFSDANPTVIDVGSSIVQALTGDFLLNQSGTIFRFNPGTLTVTPVFASNNGVTSFTQSGGLLYAGRANGDLTELALGGDGLFTATLNFRDAALTDPSALNVVGGEIYVSSSGQTRVFVFSIAEGVPVPDFNSDPSLRDQLASVSALSQAGLALIATLLTGAEGEGIAEGGEIGIVFGLGVGDSDATLALLTALVGATEGGEDGEAIEYTVADEPEFTFNDFIIGLEEALEKLRLELHGPSGTEVPEPLREAVDLTFRGLGRAADGLDGLLAGLRAEAGAVAEAATTVIQTALQPLGAAAVEATGGELAEVLASTWDTVATAGRSAALPLLDSLRWAKLPVAEAAPVVGEAEADDLTCRQLALLAALTCGMWPTPREPKQPARRAIRR